MNFYFKEMEKLKGCKMTPWFEIYVKEYLFEYWKNLNILGELQVNLDIGDFRTKIQNI